MGLYRACLSVGVFPQSITNEVQVFPGGGLDQPPTFRLRAKGLGSFQVSPGPAPYRVACFYPESKGGPAMVRLFNLPDVVNPVAAKTFFRYLLPLYLPTLTDPIIVMVVVVVVVMHYWIDGWVVWWMQGSRGVHALGP